MTSTAKTAQRKKAAIVLSLASAILASCAVYSEPAIQESSGNAAGMQAITLLIGENDGELRNRFRQSLKTSFRARGVTSSDNAKYFGDFAISAMPSDITLAASKPNKAAPGSVLDVEVQSAARESYWLDGCKAQRFRASLVLFERESGNRVHRAESESVGCEDDSAPLAQLADILVRDAILSPN